MFYFILDDETSLEKNIKVTKRPKLPAPQRDYREYEIKGRNGKLYRDLGTYKDIAIPIEMNYVGSEEQWNTIWRNIKRWLLKGGIRRLTFSDDFTHYYLVKKIELGDNERKIKESAEFTAIVICEAFSYLISGLNEFAYTNVLYNQYEETQPIYIIEGNGMCTLTVNGTECKCNVTDNLIIDDYLEIAYRRDGTNQNTAINADYEAIRLQQGSNVITITDGFNLKIIPNWRVI